MVLSKSVNTERIASNFDIEGFALSDDDMAKLATLGKGKAGDLGITSQFWGRDYFE